MNIPRFWAISTIAAWGIGCFLIVRSMSPGSPGDPSSSATSGDAPNLLEERAPVADACQAERAALASLKTKLSICMAFRNSASEAETKGEEEAGEPQTPAFILSQYEDYHGRLAGLNEAVIVQHADGTIGVYKPDAWPADGDGLILGRKFADGRLGWYLGSDAGPRSDPAAFGEPTSFRVFHPDFVREGDGTIRVRRGAPDNVKRRFGAPVEDGGAQ